MIELLPESNRYEVENTMRTDPTGGNLHLDARPILKCPIAINGVSVDNLNQIFGGVLTRADQVLTGRTTDMEPKENAFAFFDELFGAVYGTQHNGMICSLYFDNRVCDCDHDFRSVMKALNKVGKKYKLFLADWWLDIIVELSDKTAVKTYIEEM